MRQPEEVHSRNDIRDDKRNFVFSFVINSVFFRSYAQYSVDLVDVVTRRTHIRTSMRRFSSTAHMDAVKTRISCAHYIQISTFTRITDSLLLLCSSVRSIVRSVREHISVIAGRSYDMCTCEKKTHAH